jgi:hypothetical protein
MSSMLAQSGTATRLSAFNSMQVTQLCDSHPFFLANKVFSLNVTCICFYPKTLMQAQQWFLVAFEYLHTGYKTMYTASQFGHFPPLLTTSKASNAVQRLPGHHS